jgi:hypothetical protein
MIGLGRGASDVQAHVLISLITGTGPLFFGEFNVTTMGVGSVAAGAATNTVTQVYRCKYSKSRLSTG